MNQINIFSQKNAKTILTIGIIVMILALILSFLQTPKYRSSAKMLIVFGNESSVDAFTSSRASSYLTGIFGQVLYSNSFIDGVFKANFDLKDELGITLEQRAKNWKKMVKIKTKENLGIISIDVFNQNRDQAEKFARAIAYTLSTKHTAYHGSGNQVAVKLIDNPETTQGWAQPKFIRNSLLGLIAGLILGFTLIILFPEQKVWESLILKFSKKEAGDITIDLAGQKEKELAAKPAIAGEAPTDSQNQFYNW